MTASRRKSSASEPSRRGLLAGAGAALALAAFGVPSQIPDAAAASLAPRLFGYAERRREVIRPFVKWTGTLDRYFSERQLEDAPCETGLFNRCHLKDWKDFLSSVRNKAPMAQIEAVNAYMNRAPYILDPVNYGVPDYWATPRQFFVKNGDCEDYAIAKYLSLRDLGFPKERMRIVVLQDLNLRLAHAVLAVYHGGQIYILDNQIQQVVTHDRIRHYKPIYSINEQAWWLHTA
ncbi:MAG: transglutaminase-like cysteine peptidase [Alphaproteobacteria bacterium]|nr:transglutaminase-like cysteine peptidase [Alphaproteobacteria bacterium]